MILAHCPASTPPPRPSLYLLALHILLSRPLYSTLTDKNTGAPASRGALGLVGGGERVPAHSDGLHKIFLREQGREKSPPCHMVLWWCSRSSIFSDGWADRNMTPCLFPHALWRLRNISSRLISVTPRERLLSYLHLYKPHANVESHSTNLLNRKLGADVHVWFLYIFCHLNLLLKICKVLML